MKNSEILADMAKDYLIAGMDEKAFALIAGANALIEIEERNERDERDGDDW